MGAFKHQLDSYPDNDLTDEEEATLAGWRRDPDLTPAAPETSDVPPAMSSVGASS